ncbi:MAG: class I SAM-dependent rRNA methyltransferase [Deltaproteobacteria bacterium]|nr:class I SAM-dependent rRNA methyltransferase [Deltaproteobacteria bacterium]
MAERSRRARGTSGEIRVNAYSEKWLGKRFPWVYPKEVVAGEPAPGEHVLVRSESGAVLGRGIADSGWLAARMFRSDDGDIDEDFVSGILERATALRDALIPIGTDGYRLVNGENDGLPGVRIDWWSHFAVISLDSPSLACLVPLIVEWLTVEREPRGIYLCWRPDPRDDRDFSASEIRTGLIAGFSPPGDVAIRERDLRIDVRVPDAPDVGLYADMRDVRHWLSDTWGGASVLNLFAFTGAFSVAAARGGATDVVSADLSSGALDRAQHNFRVNELDPGNYEFLAEDVFKVLDRYRRTGQAFDRVIVDPPAFSRSGAGIWSGQKDWPRLAAAAARVANPGGWVIAASNQGEISPREFRGLLAQGFERADRPAQLIAALGQAPDFPAAVSFPEGRYLKVDVYRL